MENNMSLKAKFLFILFLSNASIYILSNGNNHKIMKKSESGPRIDYILLKVVAENKTAMDTTTPVKMISKDNKTIIKNIFVLEKLNSNQDLFNAQTEFSYYLIHIHIEDAKKINLSKSFVFYPNNYSLQKITRRRKYEMYF